MFWKCKKSFETSNIFINVPHYPSQQRRLNENRSMENIQFQTLKSQVINKKVKLLLIVLKKSNFSNQSGRSMVYQRKYGVMYKLLQNLYLRNIIFIIIYKIYCLYYFIIIVLIVLQKQTCNY
ncbi:unnamed protein product (macronuclear) [Paramecium tetraurelia]|uniref:Transmembrane protein n=1 Tax=Paramecium tetraurelia TaxID=5888 RepID=A0DSU7_PARTE|nr:uncharacterized protein GSPATT00019807001 [Paramecium tetraurelia]CAK86114.1 unnamed protein product [Paramecium tetraurelia]|eukprot:XP_001453511.1 hypothetical protein (macronuclear) [Paramecium tetraurelia strain d4-2]